MSISTLIVESTFSPNPCLNLQVLTPFHILARKSTLRSLFVKVLKGGQAPFFTQSINNQKSFFSFTFPVILATSQNGAKSICIFSGSRKHLTSPFQIIFDHSISHFVMKYQVGLSYKYTPIDEISFHLTQTSLPGQKRRQATMNKASASHPHRSQRPSEEEQEKRAGNFQEKRAVRSHAMEKSPVTEVQGLERKPSEDINASADAFIKRFRQHLLIQRLESIENYEQMLERGL